MSKLRELANKLKPENQLLSIIKPFLPRFKSFISTINTPEKEGGKIREGEVKGAIAVLEIKGTISIVNLFFSPGPEGQLFVSRIETISDIENLENKEENGTNQ